MSKENLFKVTKINIETEKEYNYGSYTKEDVKLITRGYKFNGLFYERKNSKFIFIVQEDYNT